MSTPQTYVVKRVPFNGRTASVAMQNVNGPCPLLAVANVLSLRGVYSIHEDKACVSADELLAAVSDFLFDSHAQVGSSDLQKNHERNVNDVITMLPKTMVGIDVNVRFDNITSFEFTAESILFDFCDVRLVHGWLVDPQDPDYSVLKKLSYNQLVELEVTKQIAIDALSEKMNNVNINTPSPTLTDPTTPEANNSASDATASTTITTTTTTTTTTTSLPTTSSDAPANDDQPLTGDEESKNVNSEDPRIAQALVADRFLNETATQLSYHGLAELHSGLKDEELCTFFRNNHFNVLYKHGGELFLLVTDQGYATTPVVWEKLCQIDGDSTFLTHDFTPYHPTSPELVLDTREHEMKAATHDADRDFALALQLQEDEHQQQQEQQAHTSAMNPAQGYPPAPGHEDAHRKHKHVRKEKKDKDKGCVVQ